jgi:hypothetical protein
MKEELKTASGLDVHNAKDDAEEWFSPTTNPFTHICCSCSLVHTVEYALADLMTGEAVEMPRAAGLALKFTRDAEETAHFRKQSEAAKKAVLELAAATSNRLIETTQFAGAPIQEYDRDSLLRIIALLAAEKKEKSLIILPGGRA